jgi:hypothetical protein
VWCLVWPPNGYASGVACRKPRHCPGGFRPAGAFYFFSGIFALGVDVPTEPWLDNDMTTNTNTPAAALRTMIAEMATARREYAAANGFTASDDEIADHIKASLIRMMAAAK